MDYFLKEVFTMDKKFFNKKDTVIILLIIVFAAIIYFVYQSFFMREAVMAEIVYDNKVIQNVDLSKDTTFSPEGFPNIVFGVKNNSIAFIHSDCPDKICVNTGFISKSGQTAVCLPNKMVLRLISSDDNEVDAVS